LAESCLRFGAGATVALEEVCARDAVSPFGLLFSESSGRAIVAVRPGSELEFLGLCANSDVPVARIGVTGGASDQATLGIRGQFDVPLVELRAAHEATLPATFGA
jgi:phosphoribosylformylglycinamidine synthase